MPSAESTSLRARPVAEALPSAAGGVGVQRGAINFVRTLYREPSSPTDPLVPSRPAQR